MSEIRLNDGKYTVVNELGEGGGFKALRYGEEWRNLAGDNLVLAMYQEIEELRQRLEFATERWRETDRANSENYEAVKRLHRERDDWEWKAGHLTSENKRLKSIIYNHASKNGCEIDLGDDE